MSQSEGRFVRPFGLTDNPFGPIRLPLLPDGTRPALKKRVHLSNLYKYPLRLDKEPALEHLLVPESGNFSIYQQEFQDLLEVAGYGEKPVETTEQFAFLISGEQGTGKSTLVNMFVRWLQQCDVEWNEIRYPPDEPGSGTGMRLYEYLAAKLKSTSNDPAEPSYCSVVIDNMTARDKDAAIRIYEEYSGSRVLVMFMITDDLRLLREARENYRINLTRFRMKPLTPEQALAFVRHRINQFRVPHLRENLAGYPLFPFREEDILQEVSGNQDGESGGQGSITLRSFATILQRALVDGWSARRQDSALETLTSDELESRIIKPAQAYAKLQEVAA
ncbi:MAG: ATP-binding protein [Streptosporangiaceae bacterium]